MLESIGVPGGGTGVGGGGTACAKLVNMLHNSKPNNIRYFCFFIFIGCKSKKKYYQTKLLRGYY